jgi:sporulation protein YlmC with PRC-barrel domain
MSKIFYDIYFFVIIKNAVAYNISTMLRLSQSISHLPVMSLRTLGGVAMAEDPIINPNNLKIEGWHCEDHFSKRNLILLSQDVRDIVPQGIAIDDYERLSDPDDLIRLKEILQHQFVLIGKQVFTDTGSKVGKVNDYAADSTSFFIQKLYISQPVYKNFKGGQLSIDRQQIVEITDKKIVVKDTVDTVDNRAPVFARV